MLPRSYIEHLIQQIDFNKMAQRKTAVSPLLKNGDTSVLLKAIDYEGFNASQTSDNTIIYASMRWFILSLENDLLLTCHHATI